MLKTIDRETQAKLDAMQEEQWELAALGEWSYICHDDDDEEEETEDYLGRNEYQKDLVIEKNLKTIVTQFQDVGVMQDLLKMRTLPGCPKDEIERALFQYARICRGPCTPYYNGAGKSRCGVFTLNKSPQKDAEMYPGRRIIRLWRYL